jgi:hypothetical protein
VPSSELTHVCGSGSAGAAGAGGAGGAGGVLGADMTSEALGAGVLGLAVLPAGAAPAGRGGGVRIAASKRLNASLVSPARASAAPAN